MNRIRGAIGIDLGGTGIKSALVGADGSVRHFRTTPTEASRGRDALLAKLYDIIEEHRRTAEQEGMQLLGIGIGTAGSVDRSGTVSYATEHLPGWTGTPLRQLLEQESGLQVTVMNDVHAIALGEQWKGAAQAIPDFACVAIGTGIGGCIVKGGTIEGGDDGYAGAFGHHIVAMGGLPCTCGNRGCWENYASVTGLKNLMREHEAPDSWVQDPRELFAVARGGDARSLDLVGQYSEVIAIGLANLAHILNCRRFLLAGAITAQGDFLLDRIGEHVRRIVMPVYWGDGILLHAAVLGEHAGVVGAASFVAGMRN
ncbi:ROK family protein [Paenibacillus vini]|uniref:Glucokinase n=1 Tax=Paenibacillus vini TaxID=1476024 RepID=A0ABQ4MFC4_9BACL|nr:ROK family protein [Paenibacillus vini]GIP54696.1 glucokinase [Paenibacillus vini]